MMTTDKKSCREQDSTTNDDFSQEAAGLYIHIPFCRSKCPYCDFYSFIPKENIEDRYIDCLVGELTEKRRLHYLCDSSIPKFDTVYIGGGTPSVLSGKNLGRLFSSLFDNLGISDDAEITIECNPASANEDFFAAIEGYVNRISFGVQSAVDSERKRLGRLSDARQVEHAITLAKKSHIDNISLDLMLGVPNQTLDSLETSLDFCAASGASHISCYMLTLEENTPFYRLSDTLNLPDEETVCEMYLHTCEYLDRHGFKQYEISNFAVPGFESRHNLKYWNLTDYIGLGPSAHSFFGGKRYCFPRSIEGFLNGDNPKFDCDGGDKDEFVMLRLRLSNGLLFGDFEKKFGSPIPKKCVEKMREYALDGFAVLDEKHFALNSKGFLISNTIISDILVLL